MWELLEGLMGAARYPGLSLGVTGVAGRVCGKGVARCWCKWAGICE
jgi:hypothetical protein